MGVTVLSARWETFAQAVSQGQTLTAAAVAAGWQRPGAMTMGSRLIKRPEVAARVQVLKKLQIERRDAAIEAVELPTRAKVLRDLLEISDVAREAKNLTAQLRAIELVGKELGMFVQRSEVRVENPLASLSPLALVQLARLLDGEVVEVDEPLLLEGDEVEDASE